MSALTHRLVVGWELVRVAAALGDAGLVDVVVGLAVQALGEHGHLLILARIRTQVLRNNTGSAIRPECSAIMPPAQLILPKSQQFKQRLE